MSRVENGDQKGPEAPRSENLLFVNPQDLIQDNPAALIVNRESYDLIRAAFSPQRFDAPQVARVATYSKNGNGHQVIKLIIIDGNTRTYAVAEHMEEIAAAYPDFDFHVRDVTDSLLANPKVVHPGERVAGQQALTMVQALRAIVPPTVEHSQIAPDRIAAHLINGWENMVGRELSASFSAIAALSLLRNPNVSLATENLLRQALSRQKQIMAGETKEERKVLEDALLEMGSIIKQTKLIKERITESAFILVASGSAVIGGERESLKQIYGLLHTPSVEQKLDPSMGVREQMRSELGELITQAFKRFATDPNREQIINNVLGQAIRDPRLTYDQVKSVLSAINPGEAYDAIKRDINSERLSHAYCSTLRRSDLTEAELKLLDNLGRKTYLEDRDVSSLVRAVSNAVSMVDKVRGFRNSLSAQREALIKTGVKAQTLEEAIAVLSKADEATFSVFTPQTLSVRLNDLRTAAEGVQRKINREIAVYKTGRLVDGAFGSQLQTEHGSLVKARIVAYLVSEFPQIDSSNESLVYLRAGQLSQLDGDILAKVLSGELRFQAALRQQKEKEEIQGLSAPAVPAREEPRRFSPQQTINPAAREERPTPPSVPIKEEQLLMDKQQAEERRKKLGNERLSYATRAYLTALDRIDLDKEELSPEVRQEVRTLLRKLGRIFTGHPDIARIIEEDYPRLLRESITAREAKLHQEEEDASKDKRTGR